MKDSLLWSRTQTQLWIKETLQRKKPYFEELVNLAQVDPLFGVKFVDITHVPIHQVQTEPHHLTHT